MKNHPHKNNHSKIVAVGEATGHAHVITDGTVSVIDEQLNNRHIVAEFGTDLIHDEHHTQSLPPGKYLTGIVREFDPFAPDHYRNVVD